jgi:hypothetical protein
MEAQALFSMLHLEAGLLEAQEAIFCLDHPGEDHIYFTPKYLQDDKEAVPGVTSITSASGGKSPFLANWQFKNGVHMAVMGEMPVDADLLTKEARDYGTFFHGQIPEFVRAGLQYDPIHLPEAIVNFYLSHDCQYSRPAWEQKGKRHLASLCQWVDTYDLQFLAVEVPAILRTFPHPVTQEPVSFYFGSRIDIVGMPRKNAGKYEGIWIVDWKSGEKSYKDIQDYEYQLAYYELLFRANFPDYADLPIHLFNVSPKKWNCRSRDLYHMDERQHTPFAILAGMANKWWYEYGKTFLKKNVLTFSDKPFSPGEENFTYISYADAIREYLEQEGFTV